MAEVDRLLVDVGVSPIRLWQSVSEIDRVNGTTRRDLEKVFGRCEILRPLAKIRLNRRLPYRARPTQDQHAGRRSHPVWLLRQEFRLRRPLLDKR